LTANTQTKTIEATKKHKILEYENGIIISRNIHSLACLERIKIRDPLLVVILKIV
jgi:hypothetical protein